MKPSISLLFLASFLLSVCYAGDSRNSTDWNPISGTNPTASMRHWIKYVVAGPRTAVPPIVWLSPERYELSALESLIVLSSDRYDVVSTFTKKRAARADYGKSDVNVWSLYSLAISEVDDDETEECILPQKAACAYLAAVGNLGDVRWTPIEFAPIKFLEQSIRCESSST